MPDVLSLFCLMRCPRLLRISLIFWKSICTGNTPTKQPENDSNDEYGNQLLFDWYIDKYLVLNLLYGLLDYLLILINIIIHLLHGKGFMDYLMQ